MPTIALEKVDFLAPGRVTDDTAILTLKNLVFEPLLRWQPGGRVVPALFSRWVSSRDGRQWEFFIRPGAAFHDGTPCLPEHVTGFITDVVNSVDMFGMKWSYARYLADAEISISGPNAIRVNNPDPIADILDIFAEFFICRVDADGLPVLGTGPYRVDAFDPGRSARLARVRGTGPQTLSFYAEPDAGARYAHLRHGKADAALNLERREHSGDLDPDLSWDSALNTLSVIAYLDCASGPFAGAKARLAANHAVDKADLIASVFGGLAAPAATIVSPFHLGMNTARLSPIPYDPDLARRLLDAEGGPSAIVLRAPTHMPERAPAIADYLARALGAVGFSVAVEIEADRPLYARQIAEKRVGDLAIFDSSPQSTFRVLDDKISSRSRALWWQGFIDGEVDGLFAQARQKISDADRELAYGRCLAALNRNPPWLYLVHPVAVLGKRPGLDGFSIDNKGTLKIAGTVQ